MPPYWSSDLGAAEISFVIIADEMKIVKWKKKIFYKFFGDTFPGVISMKKRKNLLLFCLGGGSYVGLELLWRGRSHSSMFLAGGTCFLLLGKLPRWGRVPRAVAGSGVITAVELLFGLTMNRDYAVWDYRGQPGNFLGQICPLYSLLWIPVAAMALRLHDSLQ